MDMSKAFIRMLVIAAASAFIAGAAVPCSTASQGMDAATMQGGRIGYVDFSRALNEVSDGKEAKKRLRNEFKEKQQRLDLSQQELNAMKEEIDRDRLILSGNDLEAREAAYKQKLSDVQRRFIEFRREMTEREAHLTGEILKRLNKIVTAIGEEGGYALILEKSQQIVLYAPNAEDLTGAVIKAYNSSLKKGK
jgi:outer membrane protein